MKIEITHIRRIIGILRNIISVILNMVLIVAPITANSIT